MDLGIKDKVAVVCGGSRGMGRAVATLLAEEGAKVAIISRDKDQLKLVADELGKKTEVLAISQDLSEVKKIPSLIDQVRDKFGVIDLLLNNAGGPPPGSAFDVSEEDWAKTIDQNLMSTIEMTNRIALMMKEQKYGRIVNITSQYVKEPASTMVLSNTARAGVVAYAKSISHDLAPFGITINTLCPGPVLTDRMHFLIGKRSEKEGITKEQIQSEIEAMVPMKRIASPEEFAAVAVFLLSSRASYVTGTTIAVDGGITKSLM